MDARQAKGIIQNYYMNPRSEQALSNLLEHIQDPIVMEYLLKQTNNHAFRTIVDNLGLPDEFAHARESMERKIIHNPMNYPLDQVQQALCDILFHDNAHNSILKITTIQERAAYVSGFNNLYQNFGVLYSKVMEFLNLDPNTATPDQITTLLQEITMLNNELVEGNTSLYEITTYLHKSAQEDFKSDLSSKLQHTSNNLTKDIDPEIKTGPKGRPVKIYTLKNQTENQRNLHILARSQTIQPYMREDNAQEKHIAYVSQYPRASYSVFSETLNSGFCKKSESKIVFGYSSIGNENNLLSCTPYDGQTNQWEIMDGKVTMRPQYKPVDEFMQDTSATGYNELVFDHPETIRPTMIVTTAGTEITDDMIAIAESMDIPIIVIDEEAYPEHNSTELHSSAHEWYEYETFERDPLEPIAPEFIS